MNDTPDEPSRTRRGRPRIVSDDERRSAIVKAAHEAFVEQGFARTTTAMVAARAKVSKRSLYEMFEDKTELFAAVVRENRHLILDLPRPAGEDLPLLDTLVRIFRLDIDEKAEREREAILNLIARESTQFPELSDYLYENNILRSREELIEWLLEQARQDRMVVDDPLIHAGMLMDIVFGALLPRRRLADRAGRTRRIEHIKQRLAIFLRGIQPD
ncbi:TetR/AcrR family transcriptional regulator [Shinella zoogloeoides]|uniref:TetR/AcrR family transcriptional regulator n=1 Tax=Shinella zoogloeoides TaxID=352475 RepID=UPI0028B03BF2|nr:TetR/AcrR family transcriptional regulator [Shinella zoogloeoides]